MRITIELVAGHFDSDGDSLMDALRGDRDLRAVDMSPMLRNDGISGMGGVVDGVVAVLGTGGVALAIVQAVSAWLSTRTSEVTVKIKAEDREVNISIKTGRDPREILRDLGVGG